MLPYRTDYGLRGTSDVANRLNLVCFGVWTAEVFGAYNLYQIPAIYVHASLPYVYRCSGCAKVAIATNHAERAVHKFRCARYREDGGHFVG